MARVNFKPMWTLALAMVVAVVLAIAVAVGRGETPVRAARPPDPERATLGVHVLVGQEEERAAAIARTPPLATEAEGSTLLAFVAGHVGNHLGPVDNLGNRWLPFGEPVVYNGYGGRFDVRAYMVADARGGPEHRIWVEKPGNPAGELTLPVVEVRHADRLVDAAQRYAPRGSLLESAEVHTDGPALLVAFWWGDGTGLRHRAVPDGGFEIIEQFTALPPNSAVQCVVAVRAVDRAGSWRVRWETAPEQGAPLWLFAFAVR